MAEPQKITAAEFAAKSKKRRDIEGPIHEAILAHLRARFPQFAGTIHHSPNEVDMKGPQAQRMVVKAKRLGMQPGWPDIHMLWHGNFWAFEVKAPTGRVSEAQREAGAAIIAAGGKWAVVRGTSDVDRCVEDWQSDARCLVPGVGQIT
ncbi:MAG: hypothetical protein GY767_03475 [Shimia sp.]|nr:hypothetical protein [Shimia sp.]